MSKSKSKTTSQGSTTQTLDPWVKGALATNLAGMEQIKAQPFQYFSGDRIAGFNPVQTDAQQRLLDFSKDAVGGGLLGQAIQAATNASAYRPAAVTAASYAAAPGSAPISFRPVEAERVNAVSAGDAKLAGVANIDRGRSVMCRAGR